MIAVRVPGPVGLAAASKVKHGFVRSRRCPRLEPSPAAALDAEGPETLVPVTIRVTQHVHFGEVLKITGVVEELGAWDLTHAPTLTWGDGDVWTAELELPEGRHDYKLVIHNEDDDVAYWEMGDNRVLKVAGPMPCSFSLEFNGEAEEVEPDVEEPATEESEPVAAEAVAALVEVTAEPVIPAEVTVEEVEAVIPAEEPVVAEVTPPAAATEAPSSSTPGHGNGTAPASAEKAKHAAVEPDQKAFNPTPTEITAGEVAEEQAALKAALAAEPKAVLEETVASEPKPAPPAAGAVAKPEASKAESVMQRVSGLKKKAAKRSVRAVPTDPNVQRF